MKGKFLGEEFAQDPPTLSITVRGAMMLGGRRGGPAGVSCGGTVGEALKKQTFEDC